MTKHNKDQPRDGNGKFAKMIKVTDKYGNAAYFTSEEIRGFKLPEKNPDCEPATKGYVKSLIGKTREHTHRSEGCGIFTGVFAFFGWITTFILYLCYYSTDITARGWGDKFFMPFLLFSITMTILLYEISKIEVCGVREYIPSELQKYTPPRRDECEEE